MKMSERSNVLIYLLVLLKTIQKEAISRREKVHSMSNLYSKASMHAKRFHWNLGPYCENCDAQSCTVFCRNLFCCASSIQIISSSLMSWCAFNLKVPSSCILRRRVHFPKYNYYYSIALDEKVPLNGTFYILRGYIF